MLRFSFLIDQRPHFGELAASQGFKRNFQWINLSIALFCNNCTKLIIHLWSEASAEKCGGKNKPSINKLSLDVTELCYEMRERGTGHCGTARGTEPQENRAHCARHRATAVVSAMNVFAKIWKVVKDHRNTVEKYRCEWYSWYKLKYSKGCLSKWVIYRMRKRNTVDKCRGEEEKYMSNESLCKGVGRRRVRKVFEVNNNLRLAFPFYRSSI